MLELCSNIIKVFSMPSMAQVRTTAQKFLGRPDTALGSSSSRRSDNSPLFFSPDSQTRGYHERAVSKHDKAFPISAYLDFIYCPMNAYLRYVEGIQPPLGISAKIGTIAHRAFQNLLLKEFHAVKQYRLDDRGEKMYEHFKVLKDDIIERARRDLISLLDSEGKANSAFLDVKLSLSRWVSKLSREIHDYAIKTELDGIELARECVPYRQFEVLYKAPKIGISGGKIDVLENSLPIEIKSKEGSWARRSGAHKLQVALQALMLEASTHCKVDQARLVYFYDLMQRPVCIDLRLRERALEIRDEALEVLTDDNPPKVVKCKRGCIFQKHCISIHSKHKIENETNLKHPDPPRIGGVS